MSAQETPEKTTPRKRAGTKEKADEQNTQVREAQEARDEALKDPTLEEQLEVLVPYTDAKVWVIGRPPEHGGDQGERDGFEKYTQDRLGFIEMQQFFALCSRALLKAVKEGGDNAVSELTGMMGGGDIRAMSAQLRQQDFNEAANFMSMAFALVSYVPDFLVDCYALWLRVPSHEQFWFKETISQPYDPDKDKYGLSGSDAKEMIHRFLDQNYEEIRSFFVRDIPEMINRVKQLEEQRKQKELDRGSDSPQSKQ